MDFCERYRTISRMIPSIGVQHFRSASIGQAVRLAVRGVPSRIWSIPVTTMTTPKRTGLGVPGLPSAVAIIERETDDAITFRCKACGHRWSAAKR